jgi:GDP-D-mannose dehydratase
MGISVRWEGQGVDEKGYDDDGKCIVQVDPRYFRPTEVETLLGRRHQGQGKLGWLRAAERDELVKKHGFKAFDRMSRSMDKRRRGSMLLATAAWSARHWCAGWLPVATR